MPPPLVDSEHILTTVRSLIRIIVIQYFQVRERLRSGVAYNPLSNSLHSNPYPKYRQLREKDPVHRSPMLGGWVLTRYDDIDSVLRDWKHFTSSDDSRRRRNQEDHPFGNDPPSMLFTDPPDHTRLRSLVSKAFTPRSIDAIGPRVREIVDELLDEIDEAGEVDMIDALAFPLPMIVIAEMLGVPAEDRDQFRAWSAPVARTLEPTITRDELHAATAAAKELQAYFERLIAVRRDTPGEDLMSLLIATEEEGDSLSQAELLVTLRLLLVAGNETTTNLIANGLLALLDHPEQIARLREQPELIDSAVDELLRFDSPVQTDGRTAIEDIEIDGHTIRAGEQVLLLLGAANRDPDHFADPEQLDIGREDRSHIAFGRGLHHCLGAPLARLEAAAALEALLARFSRIDLAGDRPRFKDHIVLRGMESLPVRLER